MVVGGRDLPWGWGEGERLGVWVGGGVRALWERAGAVSQGRARERSKPDGPNFVHTWSARARATTGARRATAPSRDEGKVADWRRNDADILERDAWRAAGDATTTADAGAERIRGRRQNAVLEVK